MFFFLHCLVCSVLLFHGGEAEHDVLTYHICVALLLLVCSLIENSVFCVF